MGHDEVFVVGIAIAISRVLRTFEHRRPVDTVKPAILPPESPRVCQEAYKPEYAHGYSGPAYRRDEVPLQYAHESARWRNPRNDDGVRVADHVYKGRDDTD